MSTVGYNGRQVVVNLDASPIAAIQSKTLTHARGAVDVTTDDDDGWRRLLPEPASRSIDASVEGVVTANNQNTLLDEWAGNVMSTIELVYPDGRTATAADGFFLGNVEITGEQDGHAAFTAQLQSSGAVTLSVVP